MKIKNKKLIDQRIRNHPGGSTRLPDFAHGRYIEREKHWQARIRYKGKRLSLGVYLTKQEADQAYAIAVSRLDQGLPPVVESDLC